MPYRSIYVLFVVAFIFANVGSSTAQPVLRQIARVEHRLGPVEIQRVFVNGEARNFDEEFAGDDDWLKGLSIEVKNVSHRPIVFLDVHLVFLPNGMGVGGTHALRPERYSIKLPADIDPKVPSTFKDPIMQHGQTVTVKLRDYEGLMAQLKASGYVEPIRQVTIRASGVLFFDHSLWGSPHGLVRDKTDPGKWSITRIH